MGPRWLGTGPDRVRIKPTTPRDPFQPLPGPWDPKQIEKILKISENPGIPYIPYFCAAHDIEELVCNLKGHSSI